MSAKRSDPAYWSTIRGSAYENPEFSEAHVFFRDSQNPEKGNLRYNNLFDEMEMKNDDSEPYLIVDNKETIDSIVFNNQTYCYLDYRENNEVNNGFLIQLHKGKFTLYVKRSRKFQPEKVPTGGYQDYVPPSIITESDKFYVQFEENLPVVLPQSSKKMVRLFNENGCNINDYVKGNRVRYNQESLISLCAYCNQQ